MNLATTLATKGSCLLGPIPEKHRRAVLDYCNTTIVTHGDWAAIRYVVLDGRTMKTLLAAVAEMEPKALLHAFVPSPFLVARAVRATLP